jgi:hypothetical protein
MRLIVNGAISPAFRMVGIHRVVVGFREGATRRLAWQPREPHFQCEYGYGSYETEVENDGHPLYLRLVFGSPCFFTSYANRDVDQQLDLSSGFQSRGSDHKKVFQ